MKSRKSSFASVGRSALRRVLRYFWNGVIIVAPMVLTFLFLRWVFNSVDSLLEPHVQTTGLGFGLVLAGVLIVGWIATFLFMRQLFDFIDEWMERTPGVNFVYSSIRDFFDAFVGEKRRFTQAVLVNVFAEDVWLVGFLTDEEPANFQLGKEYISVYVPQAYNVAGQLFLVKRERIRELDHLSSPDVMKYAVSGGASDLIVAKAS
jgi:uncharacterized membrane protein